MAKFTISSSAVMRVLESWLVGLRNLTFGENFKGYEWQGRIEAGEEVRITHPLRVIPNRFLIINAEGVNTIVRGDQLATDKFFYVKNTASTTAFFGRILILP